jgi:hypothetical protein
MTSPHSESAVDRAQTFIDWTRINAKALTTGAVIVVVAAAGYLFYMRSKQIQAGNAERALLQAKQSLSAGNMALAQSDLQKVYARYGSTTAGVEAAMLLAQIDFDSGKYQDGISVLEKAAGTSAASDNATTIRGLEGDGYAQMGKLPEAGKAYEAAAAASTMDNEKAFQLAKAARVYQASGDTAKARELWTTLLNDPKTQSMSSEARIRLGELSAQVAKR